MSSSAVDPIGGPLPAIYTSVTPDTVTLKITSATDANGTVSGATYDGFGRVTRSKVTPPGGTEGVLSTTTYTGFELIDTNGDGIPDAPDPTLGGRSITTKAFQDAVPEANVVTAPGRISTVFLDSLGRANTTKTNLGANYANKVATFRSYDALGRIKFKSDPYEDNGAEQTALRHAATTTIPTARRAASCAGRARSRQVQPSTKPTRSIRPASATASPATRKSCSEVTPIHS